MLRLGAITNNPLATTAIWGFGFLVLFGLAVLAAGAWGVVVLGRARRAARDFANSASDPDLETLRHERIVVQGDPSGEPDTVVAQIEKIEAPDTSGPEPAG
jgi:hypothetical protein